MQYAALPSPEPSPRPGREDAPALEAARVEQPALVQASLYDPSEGGGEAMRACFGEPIEATIAGDDDPATPTTSTFQGARDSVTMTRARVGGTRWGGTRAAHMAALAEREAPPAEEDGDPATRLLLERLKLQEDEAIEKLKLRAQQEMEDAELAHRIQAGDAVRPRAAAAPSTAAPPEKRGFFSRVFGRKQPHEGAAPVPPARGRGAGAAPATQMRITVTVPPGLVPGQRFAVNVRGRGRVILTVPEGASAGQAVEFVVAVPSAAGGGAGAGAARGAAVPPAAAQAYALRDADVAAMAALGFNESFCARALIETRGSVEVAMDWLLRNLPTLEAEAAVLDRSAPGHAAVQLQARAEAPARAAAASLVALDAATAAVVADADVVTLDSPAPGGSGSASPTYEELLAQTARGGASGGAHAAASGGAAEVPPPAYQSVAVAAAVVVPDPVASLVDAIFAAPTMGRAPLAQPALDAAPVAAPAAAPGAAPGAAPAAAPGAAPGAPAEAAAADPLAALKTAKAMLDAGLITAEEYQETKSGILAGLASLGS